MKKQLTVIYVLETTYGMRLAVCLTKKEAQDAKRYHVKAIKWNKKLLRITAEHAYSNGWHKDLLEDEERRKEEES